VDQENLSGYDFLRVVVKQINSEMRSQSVKRPLTAAFRGVERDHAYGGYLVKKILIIILKSDVAF
jgi:hypothetical protein